MGHAREKVGTRLRTPLMGLRGLVGYDIMFSSGKFFPRVWPLFLLYSILTEKVSPLAYV